MGPNYKLKMEVKLDVATPGEEQVLLSSSVGVFCAALKDGTVGFRRDDSMEFSFNCTLPVGEVVTLELWGEPGRTRLFINGKEQGPCTMTRFHRNAEGLVNTFILPLDEVGPSFKGKVYSLEVKHTKPLGPTQDPNDPKLKKAQ
jgi:hexosaminidase